MIIKTRQRFASKESGQQISISKIHGREKTDKVTVVNVNLGKIDRRSYRAIQVDSVRRRYNAV